MQLKYPTFYFLFLSTRVYKESDMTFIHLLRIFLIHFSNLFDNDIFKAVFVFFT